MHNVEYVNEERNGGDKKSPQPGIEPGSKPPEGLMLPLHHWGHSQITNF